MPVKNLCAVLHGSRDLRVVERPVPVPSEGEVLVQMRSVGLCGTDVSMYQMGNEPVVLGHEPSGIISGVGPGVTTLIVGDKVALSSVYPGCGECITCLEGRANLCPHAKSMCTFPVDGCLSTYIVWPAKACFKLPDRLTWDEGAMVQPVALAIHGCHRAGVTPGQRLLVTGAGPLGIVMVLTAKASGVCRICVTDISDERLQFLAKVSGCSAVLINDTTDVTDRVTSLLGGAPDVTIECSGAPSAVSMAIHTTRRGGRILLAGIVPEEATIPLRTALLKEMDIKSMYMLSSTYPAAIDMIASGLLDVKPLVTHTFHLCDVNKAFQAMEEKVVGKVIVKCSED